MRSRIILTSIFTLGTLCACSGEEGAASLTNGVAGINKNDSDSPDAAKVVFEHQDLDGDGIADFISVDLNGDGIAEYYTLDTDQNGVPDFIDFDGDGEFDGIAFDTTGDGIADAVGLDTTGDGFIDSLDFDGDGQADKISIPEPVDETTPADGLEDNAPEAEEPNLAEACLGDTIIDDFEDASSGSLFRPYNDGSPGATMSPAPGATMVAEFDSQSGSKALHLTGRGYTNWGAGLGRSFDVPQACKPRSTGIRFKIKGQGTLTFAGQVSAVIPVAEGGSCTEGDGCNNGHQTALTVTSAWKTVEVPWGNLQQITDSGWVSLRTSFDARSVSELLFSARPDSQPFDFWIDDLELMDDGSDPDVAVPDEESEDPDSPAEPGACQLDRLSGEEFFAAKFSARRVPFYTYANLCKAVKDFPTFANTGNLASDKQELAAFFANVARETGELNYIDQFESSRGSTGNYFGRGPIQLTWDYNYRAAGDFLGIDLVSNPGLVSSDGVVTWQTALWFWMRSDGAGKGTCHDAIQLARGFGQTINIINGGLECPSVGREAPQQRISYYKDHCSYLSVEPGSSTDC